MANWFEKCATYSEMGDTIVVGRPAFVAYFYTNENAQKNAQRIFEAWIKLMDPKVDLYYSHDDTKRIFKLTKKAIEKVRAALSVENIAKGDEYKWYYAKSGPKEGPIDECHGYSFEIYATNGDNGYVYVTFPLDHVPTVGLEEVIEWFTSWCQSYQFTHADAGFGYEIAWFGDQERQAYPLMLNTAMRYHGVRMFHRNTAQLREQGMKTLDTAAWLTFLNGETLDKLESDTIDRLDSRVLLHPCGNGIVLQAGSMPDACDVNRPSVNYQLLRSVNEVIVPVRTTAWYQNWFAADDPDKENSWFERMDL